MTPSGGPRLRSSTRSRNARQTLVERRRTNPTVSESALYHPDTIPRYVLAHIDARSADTGNRTGSLLNAWSSNNITGKSRILRSRHPTDRPSVIGLTGLLTVKLEGCEKAKVALATWA